MPLILDLILKSMSKGTVGCFHAYDLHYNYSFNIIKMMVIHLIRQIKRSN